jgi:hypothetical protein
MRETHGWSLARDDPGLLLRADDRFACCALLPA